MSFRSDITDAMILGTLFQELFARRLSWLQPRTFRLLTCPSMILRARFLPAIKLIQDNCHILNVDSGIDYRLRT
ncbi:AFG1/ZapE family ATPase [Vibrio chagasii]|nr:AFG1/ZapE family ATPase [Vibrio chagasii]